MDQALRCDRPVTLNVPDHPANIRPDREAVEAVDDGRAGAGLIGAGLIDACVVGPCAPSVARWAARRGLTPDAVSALSLVAAMLAAVWFSAGTRGGLVTGALLLCVSFVLGEVAQGRVDGEGAHRSGSSGGWAAGLLDRVKETGAYAGLAAGAAAGNLWWAALGAVVLLSVRDTAEASFSASGAYPARRAPGGSEAGPSRRDVFLRRAGRSLALPFGERVALIAVVAALGGPRPVFAVLLTWGSIVAAVMLVRRLARSFA
ncbi:hypothetical protein E1281_02900 [Actinomadura sp. KC345]|uniref:DUF5941 domain-containing protein n=1 Tax=Actinomadura sp. KC345 TaxID=2530371 RepID=UPI0010456EEE|nr:DUF5941 domain-containing protein [Actinomadura sp. KC345]TDC58004.1 hypothetical protein E1281_02900 [Actinomadura sp. KC345]